MSPLARLLVGAGVVLVVTGLVLHLLPSVPWIGKLPGDIRVERPGFRFYFPVATCVVVSVAISAIVWLVSKFQ